MAAGFPAADIPNATRFLAINSQLSTINHLMGCLPHSPARERW
jgi:hypothetical protein